MSNKAPREPVLKKIEKLTAKERNWIIRVIGTFCDDRLDVIEQNKIRKAEEREKAKAEGKKNFVPKPLPRSEEPATLSKTTIAFLLQLLDLSRKAGGGKFPYSFRKYEETFPFATTHALMHHLMRLNFVDGKIAYGKAESYYAIKF